MTMDEARLTPATDDKDLLLNQAEITFHELHMKKLTTFDFFKTLTDMHETHDSGSVEFCQHFMNGEDDPWV